MSTRVIPILLWTFGLLALAGSSFVLYNFAFNDWRLDTDILSSESARSILEGESAEEDSTRLAAWEFLLSDSATVEIDAALCTISILPSAGSRAEIHVILSGDAVDTTRYQAFSRSGDSTRLTIEAHPTALWNESSHGYVEIEIRIPAASRIDLRLATGDLLVDHMAGSMNIEMGNGAFTGTELEGRIALRNARGSVRLERCRAGGSIELRSGTVDMLFNEGDLTVGAADTINARGHFGALDAYTINGAILAEIITNHPRCHLRSDSGPIHLKLLPGAEATISARSRTGLVSHQLPLDLPDSVALTPFSLSSTINGGGDSVSIETNGGMILLDTYGDTYVRSPRFEIPPLDTGSGESEKLEE